MCKYKISIIFIFMLCLSGLNFVGAKQDTLPLLGKVIYIDPGHGGTCLSQINYNANNISS